MYGKETISYHRERVHFSTSFTNLLITVTTNITHTKMVPAMVVMVVQVSCRYLGGGREGSFKAAFLTLIFHFLEKCTLCHNKPTC